MASQGTTGLRAFHLATALALAWTLAGCGGGSDAPSDNGQAIPEADYFPLHVGDRWAYRSTYASSEFRGEYDYSYGVISAEMVNGLQAFAYGFVDSSNPTPDGNRVTRSGTGVQLWADQSDAPWDMIRLPATVGMRYDNRLSFTIPDVDADGKQDVMSVQIASTVAGLESLETPVGRFDRVLHMQYGFTRSITRSSDGRMVQEDTETVHRWFAPGVGMVRESFTTPTGSETLETQLRAYKIDNRATDTAAPRVTSLSPAIGQVGPAGTRLRLKFDEPVLWPDPVSNAVVVRDASGTAVPMGDLALSKSEMTLTNAQGWAGGTYTLNVGNGVTDLLGNPLPPFSHTFTIDVTRTGSLWSNPIDGATSAIVNGPLVVQFSDALDAASIPGSAVLLEGETPVAITTRAATGTPNTVEIVPAEPLKPSTSYTVTFPTLKDAKGQAIVELAPWTFKTALVGLLVPTQKRATALQ